MYRGLRPIPIVLLLIPCMVGLGGDGPPPDPWDKVKLGLAQLDPEGLRGPPGGKVSLSYEFTIPDSSWCRAAIRAIDPEIRFMPGSRGRSGGGASRCLCIGETRSNFRTVLLRLAELTWVSQIRECHFE